MNEKKFRIEQLNTLHERKDFNCGSEPLDRYFKNQVSQDVRRRVTACFVLVDVATNVVAGYYTLASTSIGLNELPDTLSKKLPRYPLVSAVLMGRLAVANNYRGIGLGSVLLANAIKRSENAEIAAYALVVDAKDIGAIGFYEHFGFIKMSVEGSKLFLILNSV